MQGAFATGVIIAWRLSSGIWEVWRERLKMRESAWGYVGTQDFKSFSFLLLAKSASRTLIDKNIKFPLKDFLEK